jgi:hypothetical protein
MDLASLFLTLLLLLLPPPVEEKASVMEPQPFVDPVLAIHSLNIC